MADYNSCHTYNKTTITFTKKGGRNNSVSLVCGANRKEQPLKTYMLLSDAQKNIQESRLLHLQHSMSLRNKCITMWDKKCVDDMNKHIALANALPNVVSTSREEKQILVSEMEKEMDNKKSTHIKRKELWLKICKLKDTSNTPLEFVAFEETGLDEKTEEPKQEKVEVVVSPLAKKEKGAVRKLSPEKIDAIKKAAKNKVASVLWKFKTKDECASSSRKQPYYQSKAEIIQIISKQPQVMKMLPKNYKTLSKDELCKYLLPK